MSFCLFAHMKSNRHIIATVLLVLFSFLQLVDLHSIDHADANDDDCKICKLSSETFDDDFSAVDVIDIPALITLPIDQVTIDYSNQYICSYLGFSFLNKAPPRV